MEQTKKQWRKPELFVMVRNKSEEAVLTSCKFALLAGPDDAFLTCDTATLLCDGVCYFSISS